MTKGKVHWRNSRLLPTAHLNLSLTCFANDLYAHNLYTHEEKHQIHQMSTLCHTMAWPAARTHVPAAHTTPIPA